MRRRYLFVGGPADGERRETDGEPRVYVATADAFDPAKPYAAFFTQQAYELQPFRDNGVRVYIYFHESIRPGSLLHALVAGYKGDRRA